VKPGTVLPLAQAFLPKATIVPFNPDKEFELLSQLAVWALQFTPLVGIDSDLLYHRKKEEKSSPLYNGLILDITGTERIHSSEEELSTRILLKLEKAKLMGKIAVAPTIGAAWALARFHRNKILLLKERNMREALGPFPLQALRLSEESIESFRDIGIYTLRELFALPRHALPKRFGSEVLRRIDCALGGAFEAIHPTRPPLQWSVYKEFETPLERREAIERRVLFLLKELIEKLHDQEKKAGSYLLMVGGVFANNLHEHFYLSKEFSLFSASKNTNHILSVISSLLEKLSVPGPVTSLSLTARNTEPAPKIQRDFERKEEDRVAEKEFLNSFIARLGKDRVRTVRFHESYLPEQAFSYEPISLEREVSPPSFLPEDRPSVFFQNPEEIKVISMLPDKPPSWLRWKGRESRVVRGMGPERISQAWWDKRCDEQRERDYFKIQDDTGRWLWVFRESRSQRWFVHGVWG
jgi:protein ImuB